MTLEPPIEAETLVRAAAFQLLMKNAQPVDPEILVVASGLKADVARTVIDQLDRNGRMRRDAKGRIIGSAGLSIAADRHEIVLDGRQFWTWCAYDIFGIFGALGASGRAASPSPGNGDVVGLDFAIGRPQPAEAVLFRPDGELMSACENVYRDWCPNSNLFRNRNLAQEWSDKHRVSGRVLSLDEACAQATGEWKPLVAGLALH